MIRRSFVSLAVCATALGCFGGLSSAHAQSPFTIRKPGDNAVVREKVRIQIPRASISDTGFVVFILDPENPNAQKMLLALAPDTSDSGNGQFFTYIWDTKGTNISEGPHTIRATLFEPAPDSAGNAAAMNEKGSSEIRVTVANKITDGPSTLMLRYRYHEGSQLLYDRNGKLLVVGGVSEQGAKTGNQDLAAYDGKFQLDVEDTNPQVSLVRNRLVGYKVLTAGQETTVDPSQLPASLYQELDQQGNVHYQTGGSAIATDLGGESFIIYSALDLPLLPTQTVSVGQTWRTERQKLEVPGVTATAQPLVTLENKLEGLEWENGYPTAKIHQTFNGGIPNLKTLNISGVDVKSPNVKFERDIYVAYKSGTLVRTVRTITVSGRTDQDLSGGIGGASGGGGGMGGPQGGMPQFGGPFGGPAGGKMAGMMPGGPGMGNVPPQYQQYARQGGGPPNMGSGGGSSNIPPQYQQYARRGGGPVNMGSGGGKTDDGSGAMPGRPFGVGGGGNPGNFGGGGNFRNGNIGQQNRDYAVTLKSVADTTITSVNGIQVSAVGLVAHHAATPRRGKNRKH